MRSFCHLSVLLVALAGCNSATSPEDFANDYADHLNEVADVLQSVKNTSEADTAAGKIESLLADATSLQEKARNLTEGEEPSQAVKDKTTAATKRIGSEVSRLQSDGLVTPKLRSALEQFQSSTKATLNYAKAGAMPEPENPLEEAYVEYIQITEELADLTAQVNSLATAQAKLAEFQDIGRRRNAALIRIGNAGGERPAAGGAPEKYKNHLNAAEQRSMQADEKLVGLAEEQAIYDVLIPALEQTAEVDQAFRLDVNIRQAGAGNMVMVTLRNRDGLQGGRHQLMSQMLKEAAAAQIMEAVIDEDLYRVALSPVPDMRSFINRLDLGTISEVDHAARSFVLTLDHDKIPAVSQNDNRFNPSAGGPRFRPGVGPRNAGPVPSGTLTDLDTRKIEQTRTAMVNQEGADNIVEIHFKNGRPFSGKRMAKALGVVTRSTGAKLLKPLPTQSGDRYFFMSSNKKIQELADAIDLGPVETVDETNRKLVLTLDESKVPQE